MVVRGRPDRYAILKEGSLCFRLMKSVFRKGMSMPFSLFGRLQVVGIAACCVSKRLPLATLNVKDFHYFAEHHGLELITA